MMQRGIKRPRSEALQTSSTATSIVGSTTNESVAAAASVQPSAAEVEGNAESKTVVLELSTTTTSSSNITTTANSNSTPVLSRGHKRKGSHHPHGPESLATEEGTQMSLLYQSWTSDQQERFAAFRRCTFRKETISKLVTFCLAKEQQQRRSLHRNACQLVLDPLHMNPPFPSSTLFKRSENYPELTLQDFVAHNCASEIISVVSTIAKSYAQRLVAATRQLATKEYNYPTTHRLLPQFYLQAYRQRVQHGLDPGFFVFPSLQQQQRNSSAYRNDNPGITSYHDSSSYQRRLYSMQLIAAREAEKEFNNLTSLPSEKEETGEETESPNT